MANVYWLIIDAIRNWVYMDVDKFLHFRSWGAHDHTSTIAISTDFKQKIQNSSQDVQPSAYIQKLSRRAAELTTKQQQTDEARRREHSQHGYVHDVRQIKI